MKIESSKEKYSLLESISIVVITLALFVAAAWLLFLTIQTLVMFRPAYLDLKARQEEISQKIDDMGVQIKELQND